MRNPNYGGRFVAPDGFVSSREACEVAGCSYRQLDYWCSRGVFGPISQGSGSGAWRAWPVAILEPVMAVADVVRAFHDLAGASKGMSTSRLRGVFEEVDRTPVHMGEVLVVTSAESHRAYDDGWRPDEGWHLVVPLRRLESHPCSSMNAATTLTDETSGPGAALTARDLPEPGKGSEMADRTRSQMASGNQ